MNHYYKIKGELITANTYQQAKYKEIKYLNSCIEKYPNNCQLEIERLNNLKNI